MYCKTITNTVLGTCTVTITNTVLSTCTNLYYVLYYIYKQINFCFCKQLRVKKLKRASLQTTD